MRLDHITIRTAYLDETRDFLVKVFDVMEGPRPARIAANIKGYWLYSEGAPIIHLIDSGAYAQPSLDRATEAIDHTAFLLEDYEVFLERLVKLGIPHSPMDLPDIGERRIFLRTPTGILLETVFRVRG